MVRRCMCALMQRTFTDLRKGSLFGRQKGSLATTDGGPQSVTIITFSNNVSTAAVASSFEFFQTNMSTASQPTSLDDKSQKSQKTGSMKTGIPMVGIRFLQISCL